MKSGLRANHCYTLLSVHKARIHNQEQRIVKLRNPWGHDSWNGANLFESADAVAQLGSCSSGEFFMILDDYLQLISFTNICRLNDNDVYSYAFKNKPVPELNFFEFDLDHTFLAKNPEGFDILVNQMGERLKNRKRKNG